MQFYFLETRTLWYGLIKHVRKQFVIISFQRCGSTFLTASLNSHSDVCCAGELFVRDKITFFDNDYAIKREFLDQKSEHTNRIACPESYIKFAMQNCRFEGSMFGFKLMHNQGREVRKAILELGFNPIVVLRSNLLAVYSSEKLAKSRGSGQLKKSKEPELLHTGGSFPETSI